MKNMRNKDISIEEIADATLAYAIRNKVGKKSTEDQSYHDDKCRIIGILLKSTREGTDIKVGLNNQLFSLLCMGAKVIYLNNTHDEYLEHLISYKDHNFLALSHPTNPFPEPLLNLAYKNSMQRELSDQSIPENRAFQRELYKRADTQRGADN